MPEWINWLQSVRDEELPPLPSQMTLSGDCWQRVVGESQDEFEVLECGRWQTFQIGSWAISNTVHVWGDLVCRGYVTRLVEALINSDYRAGGQGEPGDSESVESVIQRAGWSYMAYLTTVVGIGIGAKIRRLGKRLLALQVVSWLICQECGQATSSKLPFPDGGGAQPLRYYGV